MNRQFLFVFVSAIYLTLGGCKSSSDSDAADSGKTKIEFWHYMAGPQAKPLNELISRFEKANPDIKIRSVYQGNPGQLKQKLDGSFAAATGNNPVLSLAYENWTDDFLSRGYIDPVQNYIDGPDGLTKEQQADFVTVFREGNSWDGKLVTLPFNKSIYLLYMNMDMLNAAGYTTAPINQSELGQAAKKLTKIEGRRTVTYGWGVMPRGETFTTLLFASGGRLANPDGLPDFESPQAIEVMQMLKDLQFPEKKLYVNSDYMNIPFQNKMIAMFIYSSASLPYVKKGTAGKFDYQASAIPGASPSQARYLMQGTNIAIYKNRPDTERKAAWKFVKFLTTPENGAYFAARSGYMPYRYSMLKEPDMIRHMAEDPAYAMAAHLVLSDLGIQEPKRREWEGIRLDIDSAVDRLLSIPDSDPKTILNDLQRKASARLKSKP